jgi:hypothetical protein
VTALAISDQPVDIPQMSTDETKSITLFGDAFDIARSRRAVGSAAITCGVTLVSFDEKPGHINSKLVVTVAGHPRRVREFHDLVRGDAWSANAGGGILDGLVMGVTVEGFRFARRKWQGRNDSPLDAGPDPTVPRTTVYWRWERDGPGDEPIGPVWVDTYEGKSIDPISSEEWPERVRRSDALAYAREHGFTFFPDE